MGLGRKLNATLRDFILRQPMFFVATAGPQGRVNVSPKGLDSLRILSDERIVWLNLSGSGNETAGHLRLNPRMTLMFCAFAGDAMILRVYGVAEVIHPRDTAWAEHAARFPDYAGARQIFEMQVEAVQTSCGSGVPFMALEAERGPKELVPFYEEMGEDGVRAYWKRKNQKTIDGYPTEILPSE